MTDQPRKRTPRKAAPKPIEPERDPEVSSPEPEPVEAVEDAPPATAENEQAVKAPPSVQAVGDWQLVTHGTWQISVGPDGLLMLPRHLHPREVDDFIAAATTAKQVGAAVIAANTHKSKADHRRGMRRGAIVTEGEPPAGTVRMNVSQQQAAATIGRPRRGQRPANPMTSGRSIG